MLIIVKKGHEAEVKRIFDKWDLPWAEIGFVTDTGQMVVKHHGQIVVDVPAKKLADEAPVYFREASEPEYLKEVRAFTLANIPDTKDPVTDLKSLLAWPTIASKNWVIAIRYRCEQHDCCPGSDATVLRIKADSLPPTATRERAAPVLADKFIAGGRFNGAHASLDPHGERRQPSLKPVEIWRAPARSLGATDNLNIPTRTSPISSANEGKRACLSPRCRRSMLPSRAVTARPTTKNPAGPIDQRRPWRS
jgi:phosphoribosylformylglycinamidine synthase